MRTLKPVTPGELLLEEFLVPMGLSKYRVAKEIGEPPGNLKLTKLAPHHGFDAREPRHRMTVRQALCAVVPKRNDHWDSNVVRYYRQA